MLGAVRRAIGENVAQQRLRSADRHGKADADVRAGSEDRRVDADHIAAAVEQWSAAVAGIDGGVGLNHVFEQAFVVANGAAQRADHAGGQGPVESKRIADREYLLADLQILGITERQVRKLSVGFDLDESQVVGLVNRQHVRRISPLVVEQGDFYLRRVAADHMVVGEDAPFRVDDESRPGFLPRIDVKEPVAAENGTGDVDGGGRSAVVDLDVRLLVRGQAGRLRLGPEGIGRRQRRAGGPVPAGRRGPRNERRCQQRRQPKRSPGGSIPHAAALNFS